jgi:hypothetical protein
MNSVINVMWHLILNCLLQMWGLNKSVKWLVTNWPAGGQFQIATGLFCITTSRSNMRHHRGKGDFLCLRWLKPEHSCYITSILRIFAFRISEFYRCTENWVLDRNFNAFYFYMSTLKWPANFQPHKLHFIIPNHYIFRRCITNFLKNT